MLRLAFRSAIPEAHGIVPFVRRTNQSIPIMHIQRHTPTYSLAYIGPMPTSGGNGDTALHNVADLQNVLHL